MSFLDKNTFYNNIIMLFNKKFISSNLLFEICIKDNETKLNKLNNIKNWMQEEQNYIELNYNKKDLQLWNKIYNKINKLIEMEILKNYE